MIYAKFMPGRKLDYASRNKRELQAAYECGYQVLVISSDDNQLFSEKYPNYSLVSDCCSTNVTYDMPRIERYVKILWGYFLIIRNIRQFRVDVMSCHDIDSLFLAWFAYFFRVKKPLLIYDSHEFEIGRNITRNIVQRWWVLHLERFLIKRCAFSIMVNDAIADEVQKIHSLKNRPVVVKSTPFHWTIDKQECLTKRNEVLSMINNPQPTLLMYHGLIMKGRGLEMMLDVVKKNTTTCALILGNDEDNQIEKLKKMALALGVSERILFLPAVPVEQLWKYVGAADIGMVTVPAVSKSYFYMLPNKFFENIQSETPVICSDFPAIAPIVKKYNIGLTCDPLDVDAINSCIIKMQCDKDLYRTFKKNLKKAKEELCWENEKQVLIQAFKKYLD